MNVRRDNTRQLILETGHRIIAGKGFSGVGLAEILSGASVPKGSFYHYFESKEQYGQALLESYFDDYIAGMDALLDDASVPARQRLLRYWQRWLSVQQEEGEERKCLVVKLSAEVADLSDAMRVTLRDGTERVIARIARCIEAGRADGSLAGLDPQATARTLYPLWLGASLLAKLHRNSQALQEAMVATLRILGS
jgi:TetR/AcrR family transcriptional repressor of nem operon